MMEKITQEIIKLSEVENETLAKRYNAIKRFMAKKKGVIFESGCLGSIIKNISYSYNGEEKEEIVISTEHGCYRITEPKAVRIDRKYGMLVDTGYFNALSL